MIAYQDVPVRNHSEVIHPGHPPVIDTALLADNTAGDGLEPAAPSDQPIAVLAKDSDGINAEVLVCWHGTVVFGRLIDASGTEPEAASRTLAGKLRMAGIYPIQLFTYSKKG